MYPLLFTLLGFAPENFWEPRVFILPLYVTLRTLSVKCQFVLLCLCVSWGWLAFSARQAVSHLIPVSYRSWVHGRWASVHVDEGMSSRSCKRTLSDESSGLYSVRLIQSKQELAYSSWSFMDWNICLSQGIRAPGTRHISKVTLPLPRRGEE